MALEEEIETEEFIPETGGDPEPKLSSDHRKRLDSIVYNLYSQKATEDDIRAVVEDYKKKYAVPDITKTEPTIAKFPEIKGPQFIQTTAPITEKPQQAAAPGFFDEVQTQYSVPSATALIPEARNFDKLHAKTKEAQDKLVSAIKSNDDVKEKMIRQRRFEDVAAARDIPVSEQQNTQSYIDLQRYSPQETKPQDLPVTPEDLHKENVDVHVDEAKARRLVREIGRQKPEQKADLEKSVYLLDATRSLENDDKANDRTPKVLKNAQEIEKGKLTYDPLHGRLYRPEGFVSSIVSGWKGKTAAFDLYDFASGAPKEDVIAKMEKQLASYDPDEAIPVPKNKLSELSQMIGGMPVLPMVAGGVTSLLGAPEAAPFTAAAVGGTDFYKLGWANEFQNSYFTFRQQGLSESESYDKAKDLADKAAIADAAMGASMAFIGGRAAGEVPVTLSQGYRAAATTLLKKSGAQLNKAALEGLAGGGIGAAGQTYKNWLAQEAGIDRPLDEGVMDQIESNFLLTIGIAAAAKAGRGLSPKNYRSLLNGLFKSGKENIDKVIAEQVATGSLTEAQANAAKSEIENYGELDAQIPKNVAEEARFDIQDKLKKRQELESQLETLGKPFHEEIKTKITKLDEDIVELSKQKDEAAKPTRQGNELKNLINDAVDEGLIPDTLEGVAKSDPEGFLKMIADQVHGTDKEGNPLGADAEQATREQFGDGLVDKAKELFPLQEKKSSVSVIMPGEQKTTETITIKPKEDAISIESAESVPLGETSGDSPKMESGIPESGEATGAQEGIPAEKGNVTGEKGIDNIPPEDMYDLPFVDEPGDKRTGIKNFVSKSTRFERKLPEVEVPKLGEDQEVVAQGKILVDSGKINPLDVVNRINATNEGMHPDEAKAMQYYMHQLDKHESNLREQLATTTDPIEKANIGGQLQQLADEIDAATTANIKSGKAWSDVGNIRQIVLDKGFNASRELAVIKDAYGGEIPAKAKLKIEKLTKERDTAIEERNKLEERLKESKAQKVVKDIKDIVEKQDKKRGGKQKKEDILKERESLLEQLKKAIKTDTSSGYAFPFPKATVDVLGKLAVNYFKEGFVTLEEIAAKVYEDVKSHFPGATKKDVRDAISLYDPLRAEARDKKITSAEQKETRIENKLAAGDIELKKTNPYLEFQKNNEWVKANQRALNAEFKLKEQRRLALESQKNWYQKGLMWFGRLTRLSVLSGYHVLGKLASAATLGGAVKRIPEQMIGYIYGHAFRGISEKAPIEGYVNARSEAKFYKEFFNPKKFAQNSWEILKTGSSNLSKKMGSAEYEHVPGLYLPTDLHQIIKDPLKRATFEASFRNALIWAEKNGLDINDDLVIQSLETAAYKRAQYEIFQEKNWVSKKFGQLKSSLEKAGNLGATGKFIADFMIPVSTVPTNIVKRVFSTSPAGLIRGSAKVVNAYRKGMENLSHEEADSVMRQLKQGTLGTALWLIGWYGYKSFGGLYSKFDPNKKRQEGDLESDMMSVGGEDIPKPVQHALPLEVIQMAATARRIYDNYRINQDASTFGAIEKAGLGSIGALIEQVPVLETGVHAVEATNDPYMAKKLEDDIKRRFEPQILRETGIIPKEEKKPKQSGSNKRTTRTSNKSNKRVHR